MEKNENRVKKNKQLILMVLAFVVPIVAAKLLLSNDFKGNVKTHGGELLSLTKTYQQIVTSPSDDKLWKVMYLSNKSCQSQCKEQLYYVAQTYKALGRLQERVTIGAMIPQLMTDLPDEISHTNFKQHQLTQSLNQLEDNVVIIDPMGNLVMSYQLSGDRQQRLKTSHDMLLDIKQLLKLSRIG
jgi:hypothetical protein